jgi:WD40 repeat protein
MKPEIKLYGLMMIILIVCFLPTCNTSRHDGVIELDREPAMEPDYSGVTIPRNIAPMNLTIKEDGKSFRVNVASSNGRHLTIKSSDGIIRFPVKSWTKLISGNPGGELAIEVLSVGRDRELTKYNPVHLYIANEPIDPYLSYRLLYPGYETWSQIKIVQRSIEDFKEASLVENQLMDNNCVNCHSFNQNDPGKFLLHIRGSMGGTYFVEGKKISRTDLKTTDMTSGAVYPAWHPDGRYVAFSSNNVIQSFHADRERNIEVFDLASSLVLYDRRDNEMLPVREDDTIKYMETFPEWSPDGKYIYYCRAKQFIEGSDFKNIRYDLVRKPFDQSSRSFGETELVFDAVAINKSVSFPRISPDGKYLVFTLHNYGTFSIWHKEADLFLLDLHTGKHHRMSLNSNESESYHSWSSNSRWLVFSSKRVDGLTARPYFAYVGSGENIGKPFVLPQKDPTLYKKMLTTFNKPEFVTGKIDLGPRDFMRAAKRESIKATGSGNDAGPDIPDPG